MQQAQRRCHDGIFGAGADQNELIGQHLAEQPVYSRFVKRIGTSLVQDNLPVCLEQIRRQGASRICRETRSVAQQCVPYFPLPGGAVKAVVDQAAAVVVWVDFGGRDYWDIPAPGPCHHSANVRQDLCVVVCAGFTGGKQKIPLRIDVHQDVPSFAFKQLQNHFSEFPSEKFPTTKFAPEICQLSFLYDSLPKSATLHLTRNVLFHFLR
jgi:hypothetical protein